MYIIYNYLCDKLYTYLYHHIVVLDKYIHSNLVYYKHNRDDEPYEIRYNVMVYNDWVGLDTQIECPKLE